MADRLTGDTWRVPPAHRSEGTEAVERLTLTLPDGYQTSVYAWRNGRPSNGKAPVLYLHGIQSHPGWFTRSAEALWQAGFDVYQVTRRGNGEHAEHRGHARSARQLLGDIAASLRFVADLNGHQQCHLVGVSWGGKLAAAYVAALTDPSGIASLTMLSPGVAPQVKVGFRTKLGVASCLLALPKQSFAIPLEEEALFTDYEPMRQYLREDPCRLHRATARFMFASRCIDRLIAKAKRGCIAVPTTLLLASRDQIIDNDATCRRVTHLTDGRAIVRTLDGCHTMDFEADPQEFLAAVVDAVQSADA